MGGSNNSEIGICALSEVHFGKFVREHSGLCDRTNFQKDTFESVQITFQNSRTLKTEFLEPPIYSIRTKNEAVATALKNAVATASPTITTSSPYPIQEHCNKSSVD